MGVIFKAGETAPSINVYVFDNSGAPVTGKVYTDFPTLRYSINGANNATTMALTSLATETSAYSSGGIKERSGGAGCYRLDLPAMAVATAGTIVDIFGYASNFNIVCPQIEVMQITTAGLFDVNLVKWKGATPNDLLRGRIDALCSLRTGTLQGYTGVNATLDAGASSVDHFYRGAWLLPTNGTGAGQPPRCIESYTGSTKVATLVSGFQTPLDNTTEFMIIPAAQIGVAWSLVGGQGTSVNLGNTTFFANTYTSYANYTGTQFVVNGVTASTVSTATSLGSTNRYKGSKVVFLNGTAINETKVIKSHTNSTVTIDDAWGSNPTIGDAFIILRDDLPCVNNDRTVQSDLRKILGTLLTETVAGYLSAGFKKLYDVAAPIFTVASCNQTGDSYAIVNDSSSGNPALAALITNIKNNTFVRSTIPAVLERPDSGSKTVQMVFTYEDENGNAKNLDSGTPTITLVNDDSADLSSRLGSWSNPVTGKYCISYTNSVSDAIEGLHWDIVGTVNSKVRRYVTYMQIVDTTAVDFTAGDRTKLDSILTHATAAPTASDIADQVADTLFEDGVVNRLKVNSDHTVAATIVGTVPIDVSGVPPISITIPPAVAIASQDQSLITCLRGDTLSVSLPLLGNLSTCTKLVMTAKSNLSDSDDQAVIQIVEGAGLLRFNGNVASDTTAANLTIQDATTGAVDLKIDAAVTAGLAIQDLSWDVQVHLPSSIVSPVRGTFSIVADVTRSIS